MLRPPCQGFRSNEGRQRTTTTGLSVIALWAHEGGSRRTTFKSGPSDDLRCWPELVHRSGLQLNRQYRAYFIVEDEAGSVYRQGEGWRVREHSVSLDACDCSDFQERRLPYKHVYVAALQAGCKLPLARADYEAARRQGLEIVFAFDSERPDPLSKF